MGDDTVAVLEPPTEPITDLPAPAPADREPGTGSRSTEASAEPTSDPRSPAPGPRAFDRTRFQFMTGIPAGETAFIRAEDGNAVLSYRSFASVVGIIAALMSALVLVAGLAGASFLVFELRPLPAIVAAMLSGLFAALIVMLVPATHVTIFDGAAPAVAIAQQSSVSFPVVTYLVTAADGAQVGRIRKSFLTRLGRNRWIVLDAGGARRGDAVEESLGRALMRKFFGKFDASMQANVRITWDGAEAGWIIRRPGADGHADLLDLNPATTMDRRTAVALATLVLGAEP